VTTLSASSVKTWEDCHLMWYFTYVEMRPEPPSEPRETGIAVHDVVEWILKNGSDNVPDFDNMSETVSDLVALFSHEVYPTYAKPVLVEAAFELDVEGITSTGFIDSVDRHTVVTDEREDILVFDESPDMIDKVTTYGVEVTLRDLKTTKSRPRKGKFRDNMTGYHLGARELGHEPTRWLLDYLVRTKTPYYWPEEQDVPDDDEIDIWAAKVVNVHAQIEEGDWEATGIGTYVCSYCPFKAICGPYERYQDITSPIRKEQ
jgi:RecB family exonuclease